MPTLLQITLIEKLKMISDAPATAASTKPMITRGCRLRFPLAFRCSTGFRNGRRSVSTKLSSPPCLYAIRRRARASSGVMNSWVRHQSTTVALTAWLESSPKTNWYTFGFAASFGWISITPSAVAPGERSFSGKVRLLDGDLGCLIRLELGN